MKSAVHGARGAFQFLCPDAAVPSGHQNLGTAFAHDGADFC